MWSAILDVNGVEKDSTKSVRKYKVQNGKLVLVSKNDKQTSIEVPKIVIPEGLSDNSNTIEITVSETQAELDDSKNIKNNDSNGALSVVEKNGKRVGKLTNYGKKINSSITAKDKVICVVSFYDNKFTFIFVIDVRDNAPKIKGSIFKGIVRNKTIDSPDRIGYFGGQGKSISVVVNGNQYNNVPLN